MTQQIVNSDKLSFSYQQGRPMVLNSKKLILRNEVYKNL